MSHYQFFTIVCWHQILENIFERCFLILLASSKVGKSPAHEIGLESITGIMGNLCDAVRHVSYIAAFKTHL